MPPAVFSRRAFVILTGRQSYEDGVRKLATASANVRTRADYQKHAAMMFVTMAAMEKRMKLNTAPEAHGKELQLLKK